MALKRKRNSPPFLNLSSTPSTSSPSTLSTSSAISTTSSDTRAASLDTPFFSNTFATPDDDINVRTLKRYRSNRPPSPTIHRHTLDLLYAGAARESSEHLRFQSSQPASCFQPAEPSLLQHGEHMQDRARSMSSYSPGQRTSLHTYWSLPRSPMAWGPHAVRTSPPATLGNVVAAGRETGMCEDCDRTIGSDTDGFGGEVMIHCGAGRGDDAWRCAGCARIVCDMCAVSALGWGEARVCLGCMRREYGY